jgi:hypothetical protein
MLILPAAIAGTEMGYFGPTGEFVLLGVGVGVFLMGWLIQRESRGA